MLTRSARIVFAIISTAVAGLALWDVNIHGRLSIVSPEILGAIAILGTCFLLFGIVFASDNAAVFARRTERLSALTSKFESFIVALEATNARLNESEARYRGLVDAQGDAILRRAPDGRLTYANEAFCKIFGLQHEEVIGRSFRPELHPISPAAIFGHFAGHETGLERVRYDQHLKTVAGYRWISWEDYAIRDGEGKLVEIQSVGRDITDRKELEAALTEARDKAEQASRAKSNFLATISHEIRTPMSGVLGMAHLLMETPLDPDQRAYAQAIAQSGTALLSLIEDMLDLSKIEAGTIDIEPIAVRLRPLIENINELLAIRAHAKGLEIASAIASDVPEIVRVDPNRLRQVLTNLIGNAIKFTEKGGVLVSAHVTPGGGGSMMRISVRDTGMGVPADKREAIFEEFVQVKMGDLRTVEGAGLGLAISRRLVHAMGGAIGMLPAEDQGSVFWFELPLEERAHHANSDIPAPLGRAGVISSSPVLHASLRLQLKAAGMEMVALESLDVDSADTIDCDLVLFDATDGVENLPDLSRASTPVAVLLPPKGRAQLAEVAEKGIAFYLTKPVRQSSLERRLRAALGKGAQGHAESGDTRISAEIARGLSVLLAEDNAVNAFLARELLRRRGHLVDEVKNGAEAVAARAAKDYDVIVMDVHMPDVDGIEAAKRIRSWETASGRPRTPIVALSADVMDAGRRACLDAGMDGFLVKPVDPDALDNLLASLNPPATAAA